jgi:hypothetical protein
MVKFTELTHNRWIERDLLGGLTKCRHPQFLARFLTAPRKADLTTMAAQMP